MFARLELVGMDCLPDEARMHICSELFITSGNAMLLEPLSVSIFKS